MTIKLALSGKPKKLDLMFQLLELPTKTTTTNLAEGEVVTAAQVVVLKKEKGQYLFHTLISADLSDNPEIQPLKPGEFYLRDYNERELVDALVEQGWLEPVVDYSPVKSGYVNFWVYRISEKGWKHTIEGPVAS